MRPVTINAIQIFAPPSLPMHENHVISFMLCIFSCLRPFFRVFCPPGCSLGHWRLDIEYWKLRSLFPLPLPPPGPPFPATTESMNLHAKSQRRKGPPFVFTVPLCENDPGFKTSDPFSLAKPAKIAKKPSLNPALLCALRVLREKSSRGCSLEHWRLDVGY